MEYAVRLGWWVGVVFVCIGVLGKWTRYFEKLLPRFIE